MTVEEIIAQQNIAICKFLGYEIIEDNGRVYVKNLPNILQESNYFDTDSIPTNFTRDKKLKFHNNYEWLMFVVEQIETKNYGFKICRKVVEIYIDDTKDTLIHSKRESKQKSLYYAIVAFVEFHTAGKSTFEDLR